jgi:general transcription factor 3C polypeptide 5 (transcription factor C subunit 1)
MEVNAEASSSRLQLPDMDIDMDAPEDTPVEDPPSNRATEHPLPQTHFFSVEYPGYVKESSVPKAIENLGGQRSIDRAFKRMASKTESLLELNLHPGKPFSHPIPGDVVSTNNLLLKVTRRRRKAKDGMSNEGIVGEYKAEVVGVVSKTVRFRSKSGHIQLNAHIDAIQAWLISNTRRI